MRIVLLGAPHNPRTRYGDGYGGCAVACGQGEGAAVASWGARRRPGRSGPRRATQIMQDALSARPQCPTPLVVVLGEPRDVAWLLKRSVGERQRHHPVARGSSALPLEQVTALGGTGGQACGSPTHHPTRPGVGNGYNRSCCASRRMMRSRWRQIDGRGAPPIGLSRR